MEMNTKLRDARLARNLTLNDVAIAVGVDAGNLSRIERGVQSPGTRLALRLNDFYGADVDLRDILTTGNPVSETAA